MIGKALVSKLEGFTGLSALIADRIYAIHLPQKPVYPCVAYRKASGMPVSLLNVDTDIEITRYELAAFSKNYDNSNDVAEQLKLAVQRWDGVEAGVTILDCMIKATGEDYEPELEIYEQQLTIEIRHRV